jgi:hypothetical protein
MEEIEMGLLKFEEKLALVPLAPLPVLPYSWKVTCAVFGVLGFHISQPAGAMMELIALFWKHTLAYSLHGLPR